MSDPLGRQYEAFPYPRRDPAEEARRLITGSPGHLGEIEHYLFAGRRIAGRPLRALFAGGGTGDGMIMLAQQSADAGVAAEIVHLDLSAASIAIARARAAARGLDRCVRFVQGSLADLDALGLAAFDYVDCCGVLHHLEAPEAGLSTLAAALAPGGGIGLMLYGGLGRTGVYDVQACLRALLDPGDDDGARIALARRLLDQLPPTNWLRRNPNVRDHLRGDDAGLYDLLLHSRDRPYAVADIAALADAAGLRIVTFIEPGAYEPDSYVSDPLLRRRIARLDPIARATLAERLAGNMSQHALYLVPRGAGDTVARPRGADAIPCLREHDPEALARTLKPGGRASAEVHGATLSYPLPALAPAIVGLSDGTRDLAAIHAALGAQIARPPDWPKFKAEFDQLYAALNALNVMLLRYPSTRAK